MKNVLTAVIITFIDVKKEKPKLDRKNCANTQVSADLFLLLSDGSIITGQYERFTDSHYYENIKKGKHEDDFSSEGGRLKGRKEVIAWAENKDIRIKETTPQLTENFCI